jgi:hypothetical protein
MSGQQEVGVVAGAIIGALASAAVVGAANRNSDKRNQYTALAALVGAVGGGVLGFTLNLSVLTDAQPARKGYANSDDYYRDLKARQQLQAIQNMTNVASQQPSNQSTNETSIN